MLYLSTDYKAIKEVQGRLFAGRSQPLLFMAVNHGVVPDSTLQMGKSCGPWALEKPFPQGKSLELKKPLQEIGAGEVMRSEPHVGETAPAGVEKSTLGLKRNPFSSGIFPAPSSDRV